MANTEHLEILRQGVEVWNKWGDENPAVDPDLIGADLSGASLKNACFRCADLVDANLTGADLTDADFCYANLVGANLNGARLEGADFSDALVSHTSFGDTDLSRVAGLDAVNHFGPSTVGIDTIYKSRGEIPTEFLRGCGVPKSFIGQIRALLATEETTRFYSCFISYSSKDKEFAERLHADLQAKGVRVWFAPHDLPIGARIRPSIDESIRLHDKLLLVLSETSVGSQWVEQEVETALARERGPSGGTVLFPIRIDEAVMRSEAGWPALIKNSRNIGDFTNWKEADSYARAFQKLLRNLKSV